MAISFIQKKKKQKYLILVLAAILIIMVIVLWQGFLKDIKFGLLLFPEEEFLAEELPIRKMTDINFNILEDPFLKELRHFEEIELPPEIESGRENPFLVY